LATGLLVGPVARWLTPIVAGRSLSLDIGRIIDTDQLLGLVSLAVGLILFEGGLSLNLRGIVGVRRVVWLLVTVGAAITWVVTALAAWLLLGLEFPLAVLLGAVLIVTGPTVVGPLLRHIRPTGKSGSVLRWEGIVIDPIGAMIAVLVFEALSSGQGFLWHGQLFSTAGSMLRGAVQTILCGGVVGSIAAGIVLLLLSRFWVADYLQVPVTLTAAIVALILSNQIVAESGLFAATMMGIVLANQSRVSVRPIVEFKESLTVMLLGMLFIVLSARIELNTLRQLQPTVILFLLVLVLVARPLAVLACSLGSALSWRERAFIGSMAPRGIVAAAVASVFALRLQSQNVPHAKLLLPYVFLVIVFTVALYGLSGAWVARRLGLAKAGNAGFLIIGADRLAREVAVVLANEGVELLLVDTSPANVTQARMEGLPSMPANALSAQVEERIELSGIGRLLALTPSDDVNALAAVHYGKLFGRSATFQLTERGHAELVAARQKNHPELRGRVLFGTQWTFDELQRRLSRGARIHTTKLTEEFDFAAYTTQYGSTAVPLFVQSETGDLTPWTLDSQAPPRPGQRIIGLIDPTADQAVARAS
jgi:NhaP-type Na+/H+ or K+/H+ antiporter